MLTKLSSNCEKPAPRQALADCALVSAVVLISSLPYAGKLGFYNDDWYSIAGFSRQSTAAMARELFAADSDMRIRPVQIAYQTIAFTCFGQRPLWYHLTAIVLLALAAVSVYLAARTVMKQRWLPLAIALVFAVSPHYSTDRFWISSQQAVLSLLFAMAGIIALERAMEPEARNGRLWAASTALCFLLSLLSYEVTIGLIGGAIAMGWWRWRHSKGPGGKKSVWGAIGVNGAALAVALVCVFKLRQQHRLAMQHRFLHHLGERLWNALSEGFQFNIWTYGLHMPAVLRTLARNGALSTAAFVASAAIALGVTAYLWRNPHADTFPLRRHCAALLGAGVALYALGFGLFFAAMEHAFSTTGLANRVAIAAAPGAACVAVALAGLTASVPHGRVLRMRVFSVLVGLICGVYCLAMNGIAHYWVDAAQQQTTILNSLAEDVTALPPDSTLLLDGFCRFSGPGIVFETPWDTTGAVQVALHNYTLSGGVLMPTTVFGPHDVMTPVFNGLEDRTVYSDRLYLYNARHRALFRLPSFEAALDSLQSVHRAADPICPESAENIGNGLAIF